jgi:hypothetical protein
MNVITDLAQRIVNAFRSMRSSAAVIADHLIAPAKLIPQLNARRRTRLRKKHQRSRFKNKHHRRSYLPGSGAFGTVKRIYV